ncbi:unnamed protein product [Nesidiocoris tenuis]|uniref:Uncharacterized protein n=1 Tax=Nesidiocoris tenuis TaxID=355587 RepID=A0A6H5HYA4_9HEMI|nr:unnamed protein product [Nesidiocoris tenuis]
MKPSPTPTYSSSVAERNTNPPLRATRASMNYSDLCQHGGDFSPALGRRYSSSPRPKGLRRLPREQEMLPEPSKVISCVLRFAITGINAQINLMAAIPRSNTSASRSSTCSHNVSYSPFHLRHVTIIAFLVTGFREVTVYPCLRILPPFSPSWPQVRPVRKSHLCSAQLMKTRHDLHGTT